MLYGKFLTVASALALSSIVLLAGPARGEEYKLTRLDREYLDQAEKMERDFDNRGLVLNSPELKSYIESIVERLAAPVEFGPHVDLDVKLFRHPLENAFALGNGSIYVSLGLLARLEDENQLAAILAHEVSHVQLNHPFLGYKDYVTSATISNVAVVITGVPAEGNILFYFAINGYSRKLEREADLDAIDLLSRAGYDPRGLIEALELLDVDYEGEDRPEADVFWRDHPTTEKRKEYIGSEIGEGRAGSKPVPSCRDQALYFKAVMPVSHRTCSLNVEFERFGTARAIADRALGLYPDDPEMLVSRGMVKRAWAQWASEQSARMKKDGDTCGSEDCPEAAAGDTALPPLLKDAPKFEEAEADLLRAKRIDPGLPVTYFELGELYWATGEREKAIKNFEKYLSLDPGGRYYFKARARLRTLKEEQEEGKE